MKKQLVFILYDLGISLSALSTIYRFISENKIKKIFQGDYLEVQFEYQIFSDKDMEILSSPEAITKSINRIETVVKNFTQNGIEYFIYYDNEYPKLLKDIPSPPFFLFMKGNKKLIKDRFICSIVGTRQPSLKTLNEIDKFVFELTKSNIVTASGLALGTDIQVHLSTLNSGGKTIAVLPGTIDSIIPKSHTKYANEILQNEGLLISEYYIEEPNKKVNYVNRNRIISGISNAVLIAECSLNSGTMHTARFSYLQKKPLFCFDNRSSGVLKILNSDFAELYKGIDSLSKIRNEV